MKTLPLVLLVVLPLNLTAGEVKTGDSMENARTILGAPRGQMQAGDREVYYFDRGEVEANAGVVTRVALRSEEVQAALEARRTADALRAREEQDIREARLLTEGEALRARKLADPAFQATPLKYQVAFWEDFSRRYSAVSCAEPLSIARSRLTEQIQADQAQARRLAELEARVADAEAQAAEANARAARSRGSYSPYDSGYDYYPIFTDSYHTRRAYSRHDNYVVACRSDSPRPVTPIRDDRSQFSSHTAMAFVGQDWLVWPSPGRSHR